MDRSSLSLPPVVERVLSFADRRLGQGTSRRFVDAFNAVDRSGVFSAPMLYGAGVWSPRELRSLDRQRTSALHIWNPKAAPTEIVLSADLEGGSVDQVFSQFIRATSHSNPIGDFRRFPEQYAPILLGPRYFLFHGDGHCFVLSNLLAALLRRHTQADISVRYVVTETRSLMHAFVEWCDGDRRMVVDPDQKNLADWNDRDGPLGMVFQLMCLGGACAYGSLSERERHWMFASSTRVGLSEFGDGVAQPRIYNPRPTPEEICALFGEARAHHMESVSLDADDYEWKARFRLARANQPLLSQADRRIRMMLPAGAAMTIGLNADVLPKEADLLPLIFFGRVPAVIRATIPPSGRLALTVPERPWFCCVSKSLEKLSINGRELTTHRSGNFSVLGAGDLEEILVEPGIDDTADFVVEAPPGETVRVVLPFNALALNSNVIGLDGDFSVSTSEVADL